MKPEKLPNIGGLKEALRRQMRATLQAMTDEARLAASLHLCARAAALAAFQDAKTIALFAPLASEPEVRPLAEEAWARGRRVVFPLMSRPGDAPRLTWLAAPTWEELVLAGPFGIREPDPARCARVEPEELDCLFVPGLAYDARGGRLGRGGGYYDAALAALDVGTPRIGLMFACQQAEDIPREAHDQLLTGIVTDTRTILVK